MADGRKKTLMAGLIRSPERKESVDIINTNLNALGLLS